MKDPFRTYRKYVYIAARQTIGTQQRHNPEPPPTAPVFANTLKRITSRLVRRLALLLPLILIGHAHGEELPAALDASLARAGIPRAAVAVLVQDVAGGPALLDHRSTEAMNPASVMKLVTAFAALDQLGPAFSWSTRVSSAASAKPQGGTLPGDLFVTGGGDPRLSRERLWLLLRDLRAQGIRRIAGDVITDRSFFRLPPHDPGAFDRRPLRPYNVGPDALSVDYGAVSVRFRPSADSVNATIDPLPTGLSLNSNIRRVGNGDCGDPTAQLNATTSISPGSGTRLHIEGKLPLACTDNFDWNFAPLPPDQLFEGLFRSLWRELGGELDGHFRNGQTPPDAHLLAESRSASLPEVLRDMNKWSNNVIARTLLATLGATAEPGEDSPTAGARRVARSLAANGIDTDQLVIENGAGLSRTERITARSLGQLLVAAWQSRTMPELIASLPIAGIDGTASKRLVGSPAQGSAHVKTGTLDGVRSLAGYVLARNGHRYAVVLLINHPNASAGRDSQDAILEWVANR
ncbi:MAG: D-alanyl-D-alanine carboxypeptidase/D-alanyl-D-alanine-endopeptidase [Proteobacteria bacterium]|nr:D-alanyl-D-alanine carboxypeptidase/D-alanyl-D-alanine-endopeptidase [Pseudomonadota bacterium]